MYNASWQRRRMQSGYHLPGRPAALCTITHFTQSGCTRKRICATQDAAILVRLAPEVPAAQLPDE
jgi:hypothetical protein